MPHVEYVVALTTIPRTLDGGAFARALVELRLAACVNILPEMTSVYRWKGTVEEEGERQVVIKTRRALVGALFEQVKAFHPYDVPEWLVLAVAEGSPAYLQWLDESTPQGEPPTLAGGPEER